VGVAARLAAVCCCDVMTFVISLFLSETELSSGIAQVLHGGYEN
jgi:hypothetical protein